MRGLSDFGIVIKIAISEAGCLRAGGSCISDAYLHSSHNTSFMEKEGHLGNGDR